MKSDLPAILAAVVNGGMIRIALVVLGMLAVFVLAGLGLRARTRRELHPFAGTLLYLSGVAFLLGLIAGSWKGLHFWFAQESGAAIQANPVFELLAAMLAYSSVSLAALVASMITRVPNHTPDGIRRPEDGSPKPSV